MHDTDIHTHDQYADHRKRIDTIMRLFHRAELDVTEKRQQIAEENAYYYGPDYKSPNTGERISRPPRIRNEVQAILAAARDYAWKDPDD
jgi:hypothetical protein